MAQMSSVLTFIRWFTKVSLHIIRLPAPRYPKRSLPFRFSEQNVLWFFSFLAFALHAPPISSSLILSPILFPTSFLKLGDELVLSVNRPIIGLILVRCIWQSFEEECTVGYWHWSREFSRTGRQGVLLIRIRQLPGSRKVNYVVFPSCQHISSHQSDYVSSMSYLLGVPRRPLVGRAFLTVFVWCAQLNAYRTDHICLSIRVFQL